MLDAENLAELNKLFEADNGEVNDADAHDTEGLASMQVDLRGSPAAVVKELAAYIHGRQQAAIDYKEVEHIVEAATHSNTYLKASIHWEYIADFLGHLVAASFASPGLKAKTPPG